MSWILVTFVIAIGAFTGISHHKAYESAQEQDAKINALEAQHVQDEKRLVTNNKPKSKSQPQMIIKDLS